MKKIFLFPILVFAFASLALAATCEQTCIEQKNQKVFSIGELRNKLAQCKQTQLACINTNSGYTACTKEYTQCKWSTINQIRDGTIEINVKYNECLTSCGIETIPEIKSEPEIQALNTEVSSICKNIDDARLFLISKFGSEKLEQFIKNNNCQKWLGL